MVDYVALRGLELVELDDNNWMVVKTRLLCDPQSLVAVGAFELSRSEFSNRRVGTDPALFADLPDVPLVRNDIELADVQRRRVDCVQWDGFDTLVDILYDVHGIHVADERSSEVLVSRGVAGITEDDVAVAVLHPLKPPDTDSAVVADDANTTPAERVE